MMEDLGYTDTMVQPLKLLNLDGLAGLEEFADSKSFEELEVVFAPLHFDDYYIKDNKLIINFFKVKPEENKAFFGEQELIDYIREKLVELLKS
jgi:hypothetical protein